MQPLSQIIRSTLLSTLLAAANLATAAEPVRALGLTLGSATVKELEALAEQNGANEKSRGVSTHTGGMVIGFGGDFGLPGLTTSTFVFNQGGLLEAAQLDFPRGRYGEIVGALRQKYQLVDEQTPFVGDRTARFRSGDVEIVASSPHMSFELSVTYSTAAFRSQLTESTRRQEEQRQRDQGERL